MAAASPLTGAELADLVQRYFLQLTKGCGRPTGCTNHHCASCRGGAPLEANSAALKALQLAQGAQQAFCARGYLDMELLRRTDASEHSKFVISAFQSPGLLELSFPLVGERDVPEVDWAQVEAFWELAASRGGLMDEVVGAIARMLEAETAGDDLDPARLTRMGPRGLAILLSCPALADPQHHESVLGKAYSLIWRLSDDKRAALERAWAGAPQRQLQHAVRCVHEYIIVYIYVEASPIDPAAGFAVDSAIESGVTALGVLHAASEASAHPLELSAFYNDAINNLLASDALLREDHRRWQEGGVDFSFCDHPFVLDPATKAGILKLSALHEMSAEFQSAVFRSILTMSMHSPYLVLRVRRDHLIRDSLQQLGSRSADLKKPLKVHFIGEEGVDEGGVAKEYFQQITRQLFDPCWGMFIQDEKTREFWFNQNSFESSREFELIGKLIGIAIYNGVILDVRFPPALYKKLMRASCGFADLKRAFPVSDRAACAAQENGPASCAPWAVWRCPSTWHGCMTIQVGMAQQGVCLCSAATRDQPRATRCAAPRSLRHLRRAGARPRPAAAARPRGRRARARAHVCARVRRVR